MKIPWWVYLVVGLFVSVTSAVVGESMRFFVWLGLLFVLIGLIKLVIFFVLRERPKTSPQTHSRPAALFCPRCKVTVHERDYFCRYCGMRLR